jgi:hypothetical protein
MLWQWNKSVTKLLVAAMGFEPLMVHIGAAWKQYDQLWSRRKWR